MKSNEKTVVRLARLVGRFLAEMYRYDDGRTLPVMYAAGVTTPQLAVLEFARASRTVSAIALHVGLSKPATSQMIDKLVRRGFIRRSEGAIDRRQKAIVLSAKGETLLQKIAAARAARFEASLAALSPETAARLNAALVEAVDAIEKAARPRPPDGRVSAQPHETCL